MAVQLGVFGVDTKLTSCSSIYFVFNELKIFSIKIFFRKCFVNLSSSEYFVLYFILVLHCLLNTVYS
jgi:hypothetical protein